MTEILTAAQMRAVEAAAIANGDVTGLELMERAGQGVLAAIFAEWPEMRAGSLDAVVLCGPGNNGGDGFVVARLLQGWGWEVEVMALGPTLTPDAQAARAAWAGAVLEPEALDWPNFRRADLVVDAMFGTGLGRDIAPGVWGLLEMAQTCGCKLVAVDILSGICADSGRVRAQGGYVERGADLTVTFERAKLGHYLAEGAEMAGRLVVEPIGLVRQMQDLLRVDGVAVVEMSGASAVDLRKTGGHKFSHGHAVVVAGAPGHGGAARLAARGALRIGAGLVTLGCSAGAMAEHAARLDAVMLRAVEDGPDLAAVLGDARITALCIGPGLGLDARAAGLVAVAVSPAEARPTVLDADALTLIARDAGVFSGVHRACVMTPHGGEFARLFPDLAARLAKADYSKVDACREAAARAGCVVLFKGADTVIAAPDGRCEINAAVYDRAAPWLATAGSGDVLAGFIAGLLARGFAPFEAACTGAWLHVECARSFGPGLIAEDLPEELPKVLRALGV